MFYFVNCIEADFLNEVQALGKWFNLREKGKTIICISHTWSLRFQLDTYT